MDSSHVGPVTQLCRMDKTTAIFYTSTEYSTLFSISLRLLLLVIVYNAAAPSVAIKLIRGSTTWKNLILLEIRRHLNNRTNNFKCNI